MTSPLITRKRFHGFSKPDDQGKNKKDGHLRMKFHFFKIDNRTGITFHIPAPVPIGHKSGYSRAHSLTQSLFWVMDPSEPNVKSVAPSCTAEFGEQVWSSWM
jgi:hypothetical protein